MSQGKEVKTTDSNSESGLSAVELLISITIFLIVIASVYGVLKIGNLSRTNINSRSENIKNVRVALNTIGREAVNAGLGYNRIGGTVPDDFTNENFGLPADADNTDDLLTAISTGVNISESDFSKNGEKNDVVAFAFRDFQFNDGFPLIINDVQVKDDKLVLKTPDGACANCRAFDLFLIETGDGRQAVILSTDIINNNQIVLDNKRDPLYINYGKKGKSGKNPQKAVDDAIKKLADAQEKLTRELADLVKEQLKGDPKKIADAQKKVNEAQQAVATAQQVLADAQAILSGGGITSGSPVKKCTPSVTTSCLNYGITQITAKKIYLVSYSVTADGTLMRTTFGNNTGADSDEQIVRQPIANGVRSFKLKYLLEDGTTTSDPSVLNTQKERCNNIVQIDVSLVVESDANEGGSSNQNLITLTSTFSTRNLKYDVY
jgi:hypothetical protein